MSTREYARYEKDVTSKYSEGGFAHEIKARSPGSIPVHVNSDGKIYARGFVDVNDNLEFFVEDGRLFSKFINNTIGGSDITVIDVSDGSKEHRAWKPMDFSLYSNFGSFYYGRREFDVRGLQKFRFEPSYMKSSIGNAIYQKKFVYSGSRDLYTGNNGVSSDLWTKTYKNQRWFKPYKVNMYLWPGGFTNCNDLVIVKTGEYGTGQNGKSGMAREEVCWISPHEVIKENKFIVESQFYHHSGELKNSAGVVTGTGLFTYKGASGYRGKAVETGVAYLSSKNYYFPTGDVISGDMNWIRQETDANGLKTGVITQGRSPEFISGTDFYKYYTDQQSKCSTTKWDGVMPANTPFKIEVWNANGTQEGFDGQFVLVPLIPEITGLNASGFILSITNTGYGVSDQSVEAAANEAVFSAARKQYLGFDKKLIELGYAHQGRKFNKFINLCDTEAKAKKITANWNVTITGTTGSA